MDFFVQVEEQLPTELPETEETPYLVRVGWSPLEGSMIVGEGRSSYGYESSGVKVNNRSREDFGEGYTVGDTVACYIVRPVVSTTHTLPPFNSICSCTYVEPFQ